MLAQMKTHHMSTSIDEKTKIPLFAVIIAIPFLAGGVLWLSTIDGKASAAQEQLNQTRVLLEYYQKRLDSIDIRLGRIEGKLDK